jgi:hypothetical protein
MESTQRKCAVDGCERHPAPGWARCDEHVEQWLDRVLLPGTRVWVKDEKADFTKPDELELRVLDGNR